MKHSCLSILLLLCTLQSVLDSASTPQKAHAPKDTPIKVHTSVDTFCYTPKPTSSGIYLQLNLCGNDASQKARYGGDLWAGLMDIYHNDFLRRILGGSAKDFDPVYAASLNANALEVISIYLSKPFMLLWLGASMLACLVESSKSYKSLYIALLVCFALPALSWFVLGKSHSYIHRHFCFVLWYLGFWASIIYVPIYCLYRRLCHPTC